MTIPLAVRKLTSDDVDAYRAIRLEALERNPESFGSTLDTEMGEPRAWFVERLQRNVVFGAFRERELVGVAGFYVHTSIKTRHKGMLWGMYVRPSGRGLGIGKLLVQNVIDHARQHVELLQLTVVSTNMQARGLYESLGFKEYGLEPHALKDLGDKYFDEVLMFRFL